MLLMHMSIFNNVSRSLLGDVKQLDPGSVRTIAGLMPGSSVLAAALQPGSSS